MELNDNPNDIVFRRKYLKTGSSEFIFQVDCNLILNLVHTTSECMNIQTDLFALGTIPKVQLCLPIYKLAEPTSVGTNKSYDCFAMLIWCQFSHSKYSYCNTCHQESFQMLTAPSFQFSFSLQSEVFCYIQLIFNNMFTA